MNILKKSLAPITDSAWDEIKETVQQYSSTRLSARNFVDLEGPYGLEEGSISTGKLHVPEGQTKSGVNYGIREVMPFVEVRKPFELDIWELDNIERGAKDIDLDPVEEAVKEYVEFEENTIYNGFKPAGIKGLADSTSNDTVSFPSDINEIIKELGRQILNFNKLGVEGPYTLIINENDWLKLINISEGYPVIKQVKQILDGGKVIINHGSHDSMLVSERGGDYELHIGQDLSIGFSGYHTQKAKFDLTSSFTFRVVNPESVIILKNKDK